MKNKSIVSLLIIMLLFLNLSFISGCVTTGEAVTYVNINLNPSVEFILDTADRVVSVNAINDDGELLFASENFEGERIQNVITKIITLASKAGLLNVDNTNNAVYLNVVNENAEYASGLFENIKATFNNFFKSNGIYALAVSGQLPEEIVNLATEYGLPPGHMRIMLKAIELNPDLKIGELVAMPISDIVKMISGEFSGFGRICSKTSKDSFKADRISLKTTYELSVKNLFGVEYSNLLDELILLESQIEVAEGAALENLKAAIEAKNTQINNLRLTLEATYETEFNALKQQYELDKKALINGYVESCQAQRATIAANLQNRISQNEAKYELRREYSRKRVNNFATKYESFKNLREIDLFNFLITQLEQTNNISLELESDLQNALIEAQRYHKLY